jgi:hypothetical protein
MSHANFDDPFPVSSTRQVGKVHVQRPGKPDHVHVDKSHLELDQPVAERAGHNFR